MDLRVIGKANKIPQWERGLREDGEEKDVEGKDVEGKDGEGKDVEGKDGEGKDVEGKDGEGKDGEGKDVGLGANIQDLGSSHVLLDVQSCTSTALSIVSVSICLLLTVVLAAAVLCNVLKR